MTSFSNELFGPEKGATGRGRLSLKRDAARSRLRMCRLDLPTARNLPRVPRQLTSGIIIEQLPAIKEDKIVPGFVPVYQCKTPKRCLQDIADVQVAADNACAPGLHSLPRLPALMRQSLWHRGRIDISPTASESILSAFNAVDSEWPEDICADLSTLAAGHAFTVPEVLFAKITDEQAASWQEQFSGMRS